MKNLVVLAVASALVVAISVFAAGDSNAHDSAPVTPEKKVRVLIVVGHDNAVWGAQFKQVREVDLNRELALHVYDLLKTDPLFDPVITQRDGDYIPELLDFFSTREKDIRAFREERKRLYVGEMGKAAYEPDDVKHNRVTDDVAMTLYGTTLWSKEQHVDAIINVHFNDYPGRPYGKAGVYKGFSLYVPDMSLRNGAMSRPLGEAVYAELLKTQPPSNLPVEAGGVLESKDLIALGARNSLDIPAILVEYAYIAEPRLHDAGRDDVLWGMAQATYRGIKNFYTESTP